MLALERQRDARKVSQAYGREEGKHEILKKLGQHSSLKDIVEEKMKRKSFDQSDSPWKTFQRRMCKVVVHVWFENIIMVLIFMNTVVLALYYHGINSTFSGILDLCNQVCLTKAMFYNSRNERI